jgi:hypothetical protein
MKNRLNPSMRIGVFSTILLILLILGQFFLFFRSMPGKGLVGDEHAFVGKAMHFIKHGQFPKVPSYHKDVVEGRIVGRWSDFRPPGYPVFLVLCNSIKVDKSEVSTLELRLKSTVIQFVLISFVLLLLHFMACKALPGSRWLYLFAVILGIQPWTFQYCQLMITESLVTSLMFFGLFFLSLFVSSRSKPYEIIFLLLSMIFQCLTFMLRAEMIIFVVILTFIAILLKTKDILKVFKFGLIASTIFFIFIALNVAYRFHVEKKIAIFGEYRLATPGLYKWTKTWFCNERTTMNIEPHFTSNRPFEFNNLPPRAFGDIYEKKQIKKAFTVQNKTGKYNREIDDIFASIAAKRIKDNLVFNFLLVRIWNASLLWLNLETNTQLLMNLRYIPRNLRRFFLGGLLLLKICIFGFAIYSVIIFRECYRRREWLWYDQMALIMFLFIILRTIFIGLIMGFLFHRFVVVAWPPMLWCAIYTVIKLEKLKIRRDLRKQIYVDG